MEARRSDDDDDNSEVISVASPTIFLLGLVLNLLISFWFGLVLSWVWDEFFGGFGLILSWVWDGFLMGWGLILGCSGGVSGAWLWLC